MTARFSVRTVPAFERFARRLADQHPEFTRLLAQAIEILEADPHNAGAPTASSSSRAWLRVKASTASASAASASGTT